MQEASDQQQVASRLAQAWCIDWPWAWTSCGYAIAGIIAWLIGFFVALAFVSIHRKKGWRLWNVLFILGFFFLMGMAYYTTSNDDKNPETGQISMKFENTGMKLAIGAVVVLVAWPMAHLFLRRQAVAAKVGAAKDAVAAKVGAAKDAVAAKVGAAKDAVGEKVGAAKDAVGEKVQAARDKVSDVRTAAQLKLVEKLTPADPSTKSATAAAT